MNNSSIGGIVFIWIICGAVFAYYADMEARKEAPYCWFAFFFWPLIAIKGLLKGAWEFFTEW